jgi:hypothetical protein
MREINLTPSDILLIMAVTSFLLGVITFIVGIMILTRRAAGREVQTLTAQTTRLAQKGLAEDVAGLVGNATTLLDTLNQLILTTAGIGVFLTILGLLLMGIASWLALQINMMPL